MYIADMHCDTIYELLLKKERGEPARLRENDLHVDLRRMKEAGYMLQNFALFVNREKWPHVTKRAEEMLALYEREIERNPDLIAPAFCFEDIELNQAAGKMSAVLALEEGGILQGSRKLLEHFFEKGVRMITLTWNYPNEIGYPNMNKDLFTPDVEHGLTDTGRELVEAMERLGVIVDVSHLSDAGFYDVAECTGKPFVASHSNARSVCGAARNLTDSMIRILGERGGLTGLNFCPDFLTPPVIGKENPGTLEAAVNHARHITDMGGIDVLGLGSDFDGIGGHRELPGAQAVPVLAEALGKGGFKASEIDKILSGNVLRVYREVFS